MEKKNRDVKVVVMDHHFLYVSLYYAYNRRFFGFINNSYNIEIIGSIHHTDESAYNMLMDITSKENEDVLFAVADPVTIICSPFKSDAVPAVLASLIGNTAFWAVDRRSHEVVTPGDLAFFDEIIAFDPGTTSYAIAQKIFKDANRTASIYSVNPMQELVALRQKSNTIALSPDILGIDGLIYNNRQFHIDLALGRTPEFSNILMTALLSRRDVVESYPDLVFGMLKALQLSLFLVKAELPDLIKYASERFIQSQDRVISALHLAGQSNVFPMSIEVSEAAWLNAAKVSYDANTTGGFGAEEMTAARQAFQHMVQPYLSLAKRAIDELSLQVLTPGPQNPSWKHQAQYWAEVLLWLAIGGTMAKWFHWTAFAISAVGIVSAKVLVWKLQLMPFSLTWGRHWFSFIGIIIVILIWLAPEFGSYTSILPLTIILTLFLAEVQLVDSELEKLKGKGE